MEPISTPSEPSDPNAIFDQLDERVQQTLRRRGFSDLSEIQLRAIPPLLRGEDQILIAPTGTGKTESAMLPVFHAILREGKSGGFQALYITPLRSLNRDMLSRLRWWCGELGLSVGVRHGDTPMAERRKQALHPPDLLITTPETIQSMLMGSRLRKHLANVRHVVVDEIHELADGKRGAQLSVALERIVEYAGEFQRIGISATVGNPVEVGTFLCGSRSFGIVEVPVASRLSLTVRFGGDRFDSQVKLIEESIDAHQASLIFVNTRSVAEAIGHHLIGRGDVEIHHGSLSKEVRIDAEERFAQGEIRGLVCTSSMELGIDIGHIGHVVQFGSPREVARLIQRVGRAGHRLDQISRGTIIATGFDDLLESLVIAHRALDNRTEPVIPPRCSADVMANQVAAIAVERGEVETETIQRILNKASSFSGCDDLLDTCISQMEEHRLIRRDGDLVIRTGRARKYLTTNLSMIVDERKFPIIDYVTRRIIGTLDESFVIGWIHIGAVFITRGRLWRVLEIEDEKITVEPAPKSVGELPSWEGEQIPVPFEVAKEVGRLRRLRNFSEYNADEASLAYIGRVLGEMEKNRTPVPTDRLVMVEHTKEGVIINICGGHKANEALGRALSILISARFGTSVGIEINAYRIFLRLPRNVGAREIADLLHSLEGDHIEGILRIAMKRTALYKWKLVAVAKKFGAIDADAEYEKISLHRLSEQFDDTIVAQEVYRELFSRYMDVRAAGELIAGIRNNEMEVRIGPLSIIGSEGLFTSQDLITPAEGDQAIIGAVKRRLDGQEIILACMHCRNWKQRTILSRVPEQPECPKCRARLIAALKPYEEENYRLVRKKKKSAEEKEIEAKMLRSANIVLSSGKKAMTALAGRGVGPEVASRILATHTTGDAFYKEILKAEKKFIATHRFW
ncbi:ATP-dependent Lhr-like helicase [Methanocalculus alkaliphilus]|uniref:DEAD/DEAH box helicase n=1 Tax=Methanocalculus alkaliphilus TaxID=768730 RepID=UPI00209CBC3C|nr:DEAD/DEAH box helicase [Methanocalculus alkaliphilus]MCP1714638.1 ATP-dependent Lhr-like helicase [Methanocalculus alkaliphilus]